MSAAVKLRESIKKSALVAGFNNHGVAGHYDPRTQIITLDSLDRVILERLRTADDVAQKSFAALIIHEFTHWIDHVSSLWGQRALTTWFKGLQAWKTNREAGFPAILEARIALKTLKYPDYYSTLEISDVAQAEAGKPWQYSYSAGKAFDPFGRIDESNPILFTRFKTFRGESIARVPFSVATLLEVNAVAADLVYDVQRINQATDAIEQGIRKQDIARKYERLLYSPETVVYSVAAHCVANSIKSSEIFDAYARAARLSEVALNLPSAVFNRIKRPTKWPTPDDLHRHFIEKRNCGYAFWCLAQHSSPDIGMDFDSWTDDAVERTGLPSRGEIARLALTEMEQTAVSLPTSELDQRLRGLLAYGRAIMARYGLSRIRNIHKIFNETQTSGECPVVLLGDNTIVGNSRKWKSNREAVEQWVDETWQFDSSSQAFEAACLPTFKADVVSD